MRNWSRRIWVRAAGIVLLACLITLLLIPVRVTRALLDGPHTISIYYRVESDIMLSTPAGQYYRALFWKSNDELIEIYFHQYPNRAIHELIDLVVAFTPGLDALVSGQGDSERITAEQVGAMQAELDWLVSVGSQSLRADIEREEQRIDLQDFVGMTFSEAWDHINTEWTPDPGEDGWIEAYPTMTPTSAVP